MDINQLGSELDNLTLELGGLSDFAEFVVLNADSFGMIDARLDAALHSVSNTAKILYDKFSELDNGFSVLRNTEVQIHV